MQSRNNAGALGSQGVYGQIDRVLLRGNVTSRKIKLA